MRIRENGIKLCSQHILQLIFLSRPGQMPAAGAGVRNAGPVWGLGMGMPPLGFGVVPQQPGNMMMGGQVQQMAPQVANWQQQQFMAAQVGSRN